jgi:hypothetical protein
MICAPAEARPAFRLGVRERNGRECSEDGADDHISEKGRAKSLSFWREVQRNAEGRKEKAQCLCAIGVGFLDLSPRAVKNPIRIQF